LVVNSFAQIAILVLALEKAKSRSIGRRKTMGPVFSISKTKINKRFTHKILTDLGV
jgi:hypothetical protein